MTTRRRTVVMFAVGSVLAAGLLALAGGAAGAAAPDPLPVYPESWMPHAPFYATFYYQWFADPQTDGSWSYWTDHGNTPPVTWFSHYLPDAGLYSSTGYDTFRYEVAKLAEARQEVAISSWWGRASKEDAAFAFDLGVMARADNPYPNLRWALYYEKEGYADPSVEELVGDLRYIRDAYTRSPFYMRVGGARPVVFVYAGAGDGPDMVRRWHEADAQLGDLFYISLKVFSGWSSAVPQPDGWHQYAPSTRYSAAFGAASSFISPGFWHDADGEPPRLARDVDAFAAAARRMAADQTTWKLTETWNEWGEGTSVEPGRQTMIGAGGREVVDPDGPAFGNAFVSAMADAFPALEQGTGGPGQAPAPVPTPVLLSRGSRASATSAAKGHPARHAVDGSLRTRWSAGNGRSPQALTVDLGARHVLTRAGLSLCGPAGTRTAQRVTILGSDDRHTWITLVGAFRAKDAAARPIRATMRCRYVRLRFSGSRAGERAGVREVRIFGY